jgi:hypothetical protein
MITSPPFLHISTRIYQRNLSTHPKYRLPQHVSIQLGLKHWQHFGALYSLSLSLSLSASLSSHYRLLGGASRGDPPNTAV